MKKGDIVLIRYPFSDAYTEKVAPTAVDKVRPAIVISNETYNKTSQDALFMAISSVVDGRRSIDYLISSSDTDFSKTGLKKASLVKTDKIFSLLQLSATNYLGEISLSMQKEIDARLRDLLDLPLL